MRYVFLNIASFFKNEKLLFFIVFVCIIASAFIINFAYGIYYNYNAQKNEEDLELKDLDFEISEGKVLTKGDVQRYVEALDSNVHRDVDIIFAAGDISEYGFGTPASLSDIFMRFRFVNGEYQISEITRENWEQTGVLTSGRYITNEEEAEGKQVALVEADKSGVWNKDCERIRNDDGTITMFGKVYEVVGTYLSAGTPIVPFLTVPDDFEVNEFSFIFNKNITRSQYNELKRTIDKVAPEVLSLPDLSLPDLDSMAIYNNMIVIALVISILSVINFAMVYRFVLKKRQRSIAILRICGCTKFKAVMIYMGECIILSLPAYFIGMLINVCFIDNVFAGTLEFITQAYSPEVYGGLAVTYFVVFTVIVSFMIFNMVNKTVVQEWKE